MGMLDWPDPWSGSRSSRGREHSDGTLEEYEPEEMPVRRSFVASYGWQLGVCGASVVTTAVVLLANGSGLSLAGGKGLVVMALVAMFGVLPAVLPVYWYRDYRRLRAIAEDSGQDEGTSEPRELGD